MKRRRYELKRTVVARIPIGYIRLMNDLGIPQRKRAEFMRRCFLRFKGVIKKRK